MKKNYLCLLVLLQAICASSSFAQNNDMFANSPDPAAPGISRKIEVTPMVDKYTGKLNVTVPLYTINTKQGLSIPITLSYNASGIKVDDYASEAGLGWDLSFSGKVTRIRQGNFPDGPNYGNYGNNDNFINTLRSYSLDTRITNYSTRYNTDGETDLFQFEIGGHAGLFFIGADKKCYTIPYSPIKIEIQHDPLENIGYLPLGVLSGFKITDTNGFVYYLGLNEASRVRATYIAPRPKGGDSGSPTEYLTHTWYVSHVEYNNNLLITYSYLSDAPREYLIEYKNKRYEYKYTTQEDVLDLKSFLNIVTPKRISKITWDDDNAIEFAYLELTQPAETYYMFDRIKITENKSSANKYDVAIKFTHSNFATRKGKLVKLEKIVNGQSQDICTFGYEEGVNLPARNTYDQDYWGYYNGAKNTSSKPAYIYRKGPLSSQTEVSVSGASREPNLAYAKANTLNKISYPAGSYQEFIYESHTGTALKKGNGTESYADNLVFGGLRIKAIRQYDESKKLISEAKYSYTAAGSANSCGIGYRYPDKYAIVGSEPVITITNGSYTYVEWYSVYEKYPHRLTDFNGAAVVYPRVTEHYANGSYNVTEYYSYAEHSDLPRTPFAGARYNTNSGEYLDLVSNQFGSDSKGNFLPTPYFWARGMEKSSTSYNSSGQQVAKTINEYALFGEPKATLAGLQYKVAYPNNDMDKHDLKKKKPQIGRYYLHSQAVVLTKTIQEQGPYNLRTETTYEYEPTYALPVKTKIVNAGNDVVETCVKYSFQYDVPANNGSDQTAALRFYNKNNIILPIELYVKKNGKVISGEITTHYNNNAYIDFNTPLTNYVPHKKYRLFVNEPLNNYVEASFSANGFTMDPRMEEVESYDSYDGNNRLLTLSGPYGKKKSFIYDQDYVVAEVDGAFHSTTKIGANQQIHRDYTNQVFYDSFELTPASNGYIKTPKAKSGEFVAINLFYADLENFAPGRYVVTFWVSKDKGGTWNKHIDYMDVTIDNCQYRFLADDINDWIDEVRIMPVNATMKTYSYKPGFGKTSETDVNGHSRFWEYDSKGRISKTKNNNNEPISEYEYNIINTNN